MKQQFKKTVLATAIALPAMSAGLANPSFAQEPRLTLEEVIVTATRRAGSLQDLPINIAAITGESIKEQGFGDIAEALSYVPGINAVDRGGRNGQQLVVRGLNADPLGQGTNIGTGGTVATYVGEIPLGIDMRLVDMARVEVLLGPQGTLYGAGTMGGAIRYIPNRPDFDDTTVNLRGELYQNSESDDLSSDMGFTLNLPLSDNLALRASIDRYDDAGFIDQPFIVKEPGVSEPDSPRGSDQLAPQKDVNTQESVTGKIALRWQPTDMLDATLTYYRQTEDNGGRTISAHRGELRTGQYENAQRVAEPNEEETSLLALEIVADLGFAELTSATGSSKYEEVGQRDQTDLLISLEYSYETFPTFTAFTREEDRLETFSQELRLVSQGDNAISWIVGAFYNKEDYVGFSAEYTPELADFFGSTRSDNLEYFSADSSELVEKAVFGELTYQVTDLWQVTVGMRYYEYDIEAQSTVDFPLYDGFFGPSDFVAASLDQIESRAFDPALAQSDDGTLFKLNTSYALTDDITLYGTISEGYRIGGTNGGAPCEAYDPNKGQGNCNLAPGQQFGPGPNDFAKFDERSYTADTTRNHELGVKSSLLDGRMTLNAAVYLVEWDDPQLSSATVNAAIPITINAGGAESTGIEVNIDWLALENLRIRSAFSHTSTELTDDVPSLIRTITPPGFGTAFEDGIKGDRLPGSPENQFSLFASYDMPLSNGRELTFNGGYAWQSDVLSRAGGLGDSLTLDSFGIANLSATYRADNWTATLFIDNAFDEFAETGVEQTALFNQTVSGATNRYFKSNVLAPRSMGVRFGIDF